jgi:parallel beta-helix repeat protein
LGAKSETMVPGITNESIPVKNNSFSKTITVSGCATPTPTPGRGGGGGRARDSDGDGWSDSYELRMGWDPHDPCSPDPECGACLATSCNFYKRIKVDSEADTGNYTIFVLSSGGNGVYGNSFYKYIGSILDLDGEGPEPGAIDVSNKTRTEIVSIIKNATINQAGSDDLLWESHLSVRQPNVYVDDDFDDDPANHRWNTIQEGINDAKDGDMVFVYSGTYYENVVVNRTITLQGDDRTNAIIDAGGGTEDVVNVTANNCTISGFTVRNGNYGIRLYKSNNNTIMSSNARSNNQDGIDLLWSNNNTITNNTVNANSIGIHSCHSDNNQILNNLLYSNRNYGIKLTDSSNYSIVSGNIVRLNDDIGIALGGSSNNTVLDNVITNNGWGIYLTESSNNLIYHNSIIRNTHQAYDDGANSWDNGYPAGGNFWSDWTSPDDYSGVYQNESGSDGFVDNPYLIPGSINQDGYPFASPWIDITPPVVTITSPVSGSVVTEQNVTVIGTATDDVGIVTMCHARSFERGGGAGCGHLSNISTNVSINWDVSLHKGSNTMTVRAIDEAGNSGRASVTVLYKEEDITTFDTGPGGYPSISGTHIGTITPYRDINVSTLYTYACPGTGGHAEYATFYNATTGEEIANARWNGYKGDYRHIEFDAPFTLHAKVTYNYTIKTGSYPQIIHAESKNATGGVINCTEFIDANGRRYSNWIPAIRLE